MEFKQQLAKAIMEFSNYVTESAGGALIQVWMPEQCADGSMVLSAQGLPFAVVGVGDLLALYRCVSVRYRFSTDVMKPTLMGAIGRVYISMEPEMSHDVQKYDKQVYLRVSEAQRCRVHSTLVVPVFKRDAPHKPIAILELVQSDRDCAFASVMSGLSRCLEMVHLRTCSLEHVEYELPRWPLNVGQQVQRQGSRETAVALGTSGQGYRSTEQVVMCGFASSSGEMVGETGAENNPEEVGAGALVVVGRQDSRGQDMQSSHKVGSPQGGGSGGPGAIVRKASGEGAQLAMTMPMGIPGVPQGRDREAEGPGAMMGSSSPQHQQQQLPASYPPQSSQLPMQRVGSFSQLPGKGALPRRISPEEPAVVAGSELEQQLLLASWVSANKISPEALHSLKAVLGANFSAGAAGDEEVDRKPKKKVQVVKGQAQAQGQVQNKRQYRSMDVCVGSMGGAAAGVEGGGQGVLGLLPAPVPPALQRFIQQQQQQQLQQQQQQQAGGEPEPRRSLAGDVTGVAVVTAAAAPGANEEGDGDGGDDLGSSSGGEDDGGGARNMNHAGRRLKYEELEAQFGVGLKEAAANLGICGTTLKRACRRHGITRWPRRQIIKLSRTLHQMGYQGNPPSVLVNSAIKGQVSAVGAPAGAQQRQSKGGAGDGGKQQQQASRKQQQQQQQQQQLEGLSGFQPQAMVMQQYNGQQQQLMAFPNDLQQQLRHAAADFSAPSFPSTYAPGGAVMPAHQLQPEPQLLQMYSELQPHGDGLDRPPADMMWGQGIGAGGELHEPMGAYSGLDFPLGLHELQEAEGAPSHPQQQQHHHHHLQQQQQQQQSAQPVCSSSSMALWQELFSRHGDAEELTSGNMRMAM